MNELRSTEILDKEIQADARKKAEKIINSSKEQRDAILKSVSERIEQAKKERALKYEEKIAAFEKDEEASIPLEKQRFFLLKHHPAEVGGADNCWGRLPPGGKIPRDWYDGL